MGRVLLVKNSRDEWELPGGRPEEGEEHAQTLAREFMEELSIKISMSAPIDSYLFEVIPGRHVFIVTYGCELIGEFQPVISEEHDEYCMWPVNRISELNLPEMYKRSMRSGRMRPKQSMQRAIRFAMTRPQHVSLNLKESQTMTPIGKFA